MAFFDNMLFVTEQFTARKSSGNIPSGTQSQSILNDAEESQLSVHNTEQFQTEDDTEEIENEVNKTFQTIPICKNKRPLTDTPLEKNPPLKKLKNNDKAKREIVIEKLLKIEQEKLKQFKETAQQQQQRLDDDSYFLLSLVPYFKELPNHRKLHIRAKFLNLLTEEHNTLCRQRTLQQAGQVAQTFVPVPTPSPSYSISTDYSQHQSPAETISKDSVYLNLQTASEQETVTADYYANFQPNI